MNVEGAALSYGANGLAQYIDMPCQQIVAVTLQQIYGEEIGAARMPGATVIGHLASIEGFDIGCNALRLLHPTCFAIFKEGALIKVGGIAIVLQMGSKSSVHFR